MRTKEELFNYIGKEDSVYGYSRSYKLVLFRILFTDLRCLERERKNTWSFCWEIILDIVIVRKEKNIT